MNAELAKGLDQISIVERGIPIAFAIPIAKGGVNVEHRTVRGTATQEVVDAHNEEMDFASVVKCLDTWRGNIREMHQPSAVGRAVDIQILDNEKSVEVESYISKGAENAWQKCLDGTYRYYSIAGIGDRVMGVRSDGSRGPRILMKHINEISLVDAGSCPTATISVVKMVDGAPVSQLADDAPFKSGATHPITGPVTKDAAVQILAGVVRKGAFRSERYDIYQACYALQSLEELIVNESFELKVEEGGTDNTAQIALLRMAAQIVLDFLMTEFDQQFGDETAIANAVDALTDDGQKTVVKGFIAKRAERKTADAATVQKMHDTLAKMGAACTGASTMTTEKTSETPATPATDVVKTVETPAAVPAVPVIETPAATPAIPAVEPPSTEVVKTAAVAPVAAAAGITAEQVNDIVQKAIGTVTTSLETKLAEQKATSDTTIAKLNEQIEKLKGEPAPGGPVANASATAVEKVLAGGGNPVDAALTDAGIASEVVKALIEVAKSSSDPAQREAIALKVVKLQQLHGLGASIVPMPSAR